MEEKQEEQEQQHQQEQEEEAYNSLVVHVQNNEEIGLVKAPGISLATKWSILIGQNTRYMCGTR